MNKSLRTFLSGFAVAALAILLPAVSAQPAPSIIGTWKLNVEKSKFNGVPAPKSQTVTFANVGDSLKVVAKIVNADGTNSESEYTAKYGGQDVPLKGSAIADTVSIKQIDALSALRTDKKGGKEVQTIKRELAKDGKTFTAIVSGSNAKGEKVTNTVLFERQ